MIDKYKPIKDVNTHQFVKGLLIAGVLHGISEYDDWYEIIYGSKTR
jgi:hypothetical protein